MGAIVRAGGRLGCVADGTICEHGSLAVADGCEWVRISDLHYTNLYTVCPPEVPAEKTQTAV